MLPGKPQPKERARRGRGGRWYTPDATSRFESDIAWRAQAALCQSRGWPISARYATTVRCYMPDARRRDGDNVLKSVMDACNGVLWDDDSQVVRKTVEVHVDRDNPRTEVEVEVRR